MIYVFTNQKFDFNANQISLLKANQINLFYDWYNSKTEVGLDTETSGLDFTSNLLLLGIGDKITQFIFDNEHSLLIKEKLKEPKVFIGHEIKFDLSILYYTLGFWLHKTWDTIIADQRLYQGYGITKKNPTGIRFGLVNTTARHTKYSRKSTKNIRNQFIGKTLSNFVINQDQILYLADDIIPLLEIKERQKQLVIENELIFQQYKIEQPLVKVIAKMECRGITLDTTKWKQNIENNKKVKFESEVNLDKVTKHIKETYVRQEQQKYLDNWIFTKTRYKEPELISLDLFGNKHTNLHTVYGLPKSKKVKFNENVADWKSSLFIIKLFAKMELPIPTKENKALIPILHKNKIIKNLGIKPEDLKDWIKFKEGTYITTSFNEMGSKYETLANSNIISDFDKLISHTGFSCGAKQWAIYLKLNPDTNLKEFIETFLLYSESKTKISNFGENYLNKIHPITNKLHTLYRQCEAITGRLQSGGRKKQPDKFNSQNLPRSNNYRSCFVADAGRSFMTADLSSAEVVILADKSNDTNIIKMHFENDDVHSPIAQTCWRNIYLYRAGLKLGYWNEPKYFWSHKNSLNKTAFLTKPKALENFELSETFTITKKINKDLRTDFKPITFGTVYGAYAKKVSEVLNISFNEGQIVVDTIKSLMPDAFKLVTSFINFVFGRQYNGVYSQQPKGYLILNNRTKSKLWFPSVRRAMKNNVELEWHEIADSQNNARNAPIQGTQADMIKEIMVKIDDFFVSNNIDAHLLMQVHDELVIDLPKELDGKSEEYLKAPITFLYNNIQLPLPNIIANIMTDTCNLYLSNVKMSVEWEIEDYWKK